MTKQENIEARNAIEELTETLKGCINCGMCKSLCGVFRVMREESVSPRGQVMMLNDRVLDKIVFQCNLCKACEEKCPLNIKICDAISKAREAMVLSGKELKENNDMIENIRKSGNPFGTGDIKDLEKLYCC
jgi:heterodisulfide reductase subunit C